MPERILIAEDDHKQADILRRFLEHGGFSATVVPDGASAVEAARRLAADLLVLDLGLPRLDGLAVCRIVRAEQDLPIIMLTGRNREDDVLLGLRLGADDYVTKPYRPQEIVERVRTVLRRAKRAACHRVGGLVVVPAHREVMVDGVPVDTTPGEFGIIACLAAAPGRPFTRRVLLARISRTATESTERTIDTHVRNLRRKIEVDPARPRYLRTVHGIGYKLVAADGP
ncbi:MAG TPA: response regulator transcription factor [Yinghuangia sp.]|uniref:response regulator transcription factor n=1 Tax=Yinghuangia sp. YIM S10712 TaxID=3436930 RepID=UPI002CD2ED05|nr:response regulator transcription factor [Yinghuangia sp.]